MKLICSRPKSWVAVDQDESSSDIEMTKFLKRLKLSQYVDTFKKNLIKYSDLPGVTKDDLIEMDITVLKHRKILLEAIREITSYQTSSSDDEKDINAGTRMFMFIHMIKILHYGVSGTKTRTSFKTSRHEWKKTERKLSVERRKDEEMLKMQEELRSFRLQEQERKLQKEREKEERKQKVLREEQENMEHQERLERVEKEIQRKKEELAKLEREEQKRKQSLLNMEEERVQLLKKLEMEVKQLQKKKEEEKLKLKIISDDKQETIQSDATQSAAVGQQANSSTAVVPKKDDRKEFVINVPKFLVLSKI